MNVTGSIVRGTYTSSWSASWTCLPFAISFVYFLPWMQLSSICLSHQNWLAMSVTLIEVFFSLPSTLASAIWNRPYKTDQTAYLSS